MNRNSATRTAVTTTVALMMFVLGGCMDGFKGTIELDVRQPTTPGQIDESARDLHAIEGPADFVVHFPTRTVAGRYRGIVVYAPAGNALRDDLAFDDPVLAIDAVDFDFEFADDPDTVIGYFERLKDDFDVAGGDLEQIDEFIAHIETSTDAAGGEFLLEDFERTPGGGHLLAFGLEHTDDFTAVVRFRVMGDADVVAMTLNYRFDNGTTDDAE